MSFGTPVEIYLCVKKSEDEAGEVLSCVQLSGEDWNEQGVRKTLAKLVEFTSVAHMSILEGDASKLCIRTNI